MQKETQNASKYGRHTQLVTGFQGKLISVNDEDDGSSSMGVVSSELRNLLI